MTKYRVPYFGLVVNNSTVSQIWPGKLELKGRNGLRCGHFEK